MLIFVYEGICFYTSPCHAADVHNIESKMNKRALLPFTAMCFCKLKSDQGAVLSVAVSTLTSASVNLFHG